MYTAYYGLREEPFNITSDPSFFFESAQHSEAFQHLLYGIRSRKGIIVMTGDIGAGKTTLCRTLLNHLDPNVKTAFILNPCFSDTQLLKLILKDLGVETKAKTKLDLINTLNDFLLHETAMGNNVVIIIDEAQNLNIRQLEQIRLLSNLETEKEKLLQIILVGQPELFDKLKLPQLKQLNQRVTVRFHINPLKEEEIKNYIHHRLKIAEADEKLHFTYQAMEAVWQHTHGIPRLINILCDRALLAGYVSETFMITDKIVHQCAREVR